MKHRIASLFAILLIYTCATGCESSPVSDSWRDPAFTSHIRFKRTLALAMTSDVLVRRIAEDEIVRQFSEGRSIQAYKLISDADRYDSEHLRPKLQANGIDAVVAMRLISSKTDVSWLPGSGRYPYDQFWTYYDRSWPAAREPGYLKDEPTLRLQTNIYSVSDGKLIWTSISDLFAPADAQTAVDNICKNVGKQLHREGLLQ
jgi:hypothetical protein